MAKKESSTLILVTAPKHLLSCVFCGHRHLKRPPGQLQGSHALGPRTNYLGGSPAQPRSQYTNLNVGGAAGTDGSGFAWKKYTIAAAGGEERAISDTQSEGGRGWGAFSVNFFTNQHSTESPMKTVILIVSAPIC